ncbi:unnamed protein product, partial [Urochloa humidicola]
HPQQPDPTLSPPSSRSVVSPQSRSLLTHPLRSPSTAAAPTAATAAPTTGAAGSPPSKQRTRRRQATSPWSHHGSGREGMGTGARLFSHSHSPLALRPGSSVQVQPRVSTMLLWRWQRRQINREQPMANPAAPGGMILFLQAVFHCQRGGADAAAHRPNGRPGVRSCYEHGCSCPWIQPEHGYSCLLLRKISLGGMGYARLNMLGTIQL